MRIHIVDSRSTISRPWAAPYTLVKVGVDEFIAWSSRISMPDDTSYKVNSCGVQVFRPTPALSRIEETKISMTGNH